MIHERFTRIVDMAPAGNGLGIDGQFIPYAALRERIAGLAAGLIARGIGPGTPVAILMPNGPELFTAIHALFAIGAIAMPLGTGATRAEIHAAAAKAGATALIATPALARLAAEVAGLLPPPAPVFISGEAGDFGLAQLERTPPGALPSLPGTTPALYLLSSGSTGLPKIVPHSHAELLADGRRTSTAWQLTPDDRVFDMLPANFAMGLLLGAIDALEAGASTIYWSDPRPLALARRALLETLQRERITMMGAVPAMYDMLAGTPDAPRPALRLAFSGGAGLQRTTFERARDVLGIGLRQAYGSTEAIMVAHNDAADLDHMWASVGRPAGDAEIRLDHSIGGLPEGVGELMVRSSSLTSGYLGDEAANAASFRDGWLLTGDLARIDAAGHIFITGRSKLLIEISGYKIDPIEVERVLEAHRGVREAAVLGVTGGPGRSARLKAIVVVEDIAADDTGADALLRYLRERLSPQKVPALIEFRAALPRSATGKLLRGQLNEA